MSAVHQSAFEAPAAHWARFSRYVVRGGYIRPAPGADLETYSPWDIFRRSTLPDALDAPHRALLSLHQDLDLRSLTPTRTDEAIILKWCERYGLLGLLLQEMQMVVMAPRWSASPPGILVRDAARALVHPVARRFTRGVRGWTERSTTWAVFSRDHIDDGQLVSVGDRAPEQWRTQGWDHAWALRRSMDGDWVKEGLPTTWGRFFPDVPEAERETYSYPAPCGPEFWRLYAEPVEDFLRAAATLYEILDSLRTQATGKTKPRHSANSKASPADDAQSTHRAVANLDLLFNSIHPCLHFGPDGSFQMQWTSASLFGALTMMAAQDILGGRKMIVCGNANCERLFIAEAYQARFCSDRCRYAVQKRTYRGRVKARAEKGASKHRRRVTTSRSRSPRPQPPKRP